MVLELWGRGNLATTGSCSHKADRLAHKTDKPSLTVLLLLPTLSPGPSHPHAVVGTCLSESKDLSRGVNGYESQSQARGELRGADRGKGKCCPRIGVSVRTPCAWLAGSQGGEVSGGKGKPDPLESLLTSLQQLWGVTH